MEFSLRRPLIIGFTALGLMGTSHAIDMSDAAIIERIQPVGNVYLSSDAPVVEIALGPRSGDAVYGNFCAACHTSGVMGAPKMKDEADWAPRLAQGMDLLSEHAINGYNAMPAKGSCMDCSDDEIIAAINYMIEGIK